MISSEAIIFSYLTNNWDRLYAGGNDLFVRYVHLRRNGIGMFWGKAIEEIRFERLKFCFDDKIYEMWISNFNFLWILKSLNWEIVLRLPVDSFQLPEGKGRNSSWENEPQ